MPATRHERCANASSCAAPPPRAVYKRFQITQKAVVDWLYRKLPPLKSRNKAVNKTKRFVAMAACNMTFGVLASLLASPLVVVGANMAIQGSGLEAVLGVPHYSSSLRCAADIFVRRGILAFWPVRTTRSPSPLPLLRRSKSHDMMGAHRAWCRSCMAKCGRWRSPRPSWPSSSTPAHTSARTNRAEDEKTSYPLGETPALYRMSCCCD
jgi:hypothetical protein